MSLDKHWLFAGVNYVLVLSQLSVYGEVGEKVMNVKVSYLRFDVDLKSEVFIGRMDNNHLKFGLDPKHTHTHARARTHTHTHTHTHKLNLLMVDFVLQERLILLKVVYYTIP